MVTPYAMEQIKNRFYQYAVKTKNMKEITEERLEEVKSDLEVYKERILNGDNKRSPMYKLDRYYNCLRYVDGKRHYTFDEKMAFVINLVDPDCTMYIAYRALDIIPKEEIEAMEDPKEQTAAKLKNDITIGEYQSAMRAELGFYEGRLVKFEEQYYKRFIKKFIPFAGKDYSDVLFTSQHDFSNITTFQYLRVKEKALDYIEKVGQTDPKTIIYHLLFQNNLLRLYTSEEKLLFFIMVYDPELDHLNIYDDECMWDKIEEKIREEKGYFNRNLIIIEKEYCKAFDLQSKRKNLW